MQKFKILQTKTYCLSVQTTLVHPQYLVVIVGLSILLWSWCSVFSGDRGAQYLVVIVVLSI